MLVQVSFDKSNPKIAGDWKFNAFSDFSELTTTDFKEETLPPTIAEVSI